MKKIAHSEDCEESKRELYEQMTILLLRHLKKKINGNIPVLEYNEMRILKC